MGWSTVTFSEKNIVDTSRNRIPITTSCGGKDIEHFLYQYNKYKVAFSDFKTNATIYTIKPAIYTGLIINDCIANCCVSDSWSLSVCLEYAPKMISII